MRTNFLLFFIACWGFLNAQIPQPLSVNTFTDFSYPNVEPTYDYDLLYPINADVLSANPQNFEPSLTNRYFMSIFGPRHKAVSTSNIGYFDYHIGSDMTADVTYGGVTYSEGNAPHIICRCNGQVYEIFDGNNAQMEATGTGRYVTVRCDSTFRANPEWGNMYMAYRHLASVFPGLQEGDIVAMGDTIGLMGSSGETSTVHLHFSLIRRNDGTSRNVNPMRTFDPNAIPHLLSHLTTAEITQLKHNADQALFRIAVPYNMANFSAIEVSLPNGVYYRKYDFEEISDLDTEYRDDNNSVDGLELFAYPFNQGQDCHRRVWDAIQDDDMPAPYPGSPDHNDGHFFPFMREGLNETPAYVLDLLVKDLPPGYNIEDLNIRIIDIWGYGLEANGTLQASDEHFAWAMIDTENNDAEEYQNGTMDLSSADIDLVYDGSTVGNQRIGLRFTNVDIPKDVTITNAFVQFRADATHSAAVNLKVHAEDSGASAIFNTTAGNISARDTTHAGLTWTPAAWTIDDMDEAQKLNGLAPLVQEVVLRNDWTSDSPLTFLIRGSGRREAEAYSSVDLWKNAYVYLEYIETQAPPSNEPPIITLTSPANGVEYNELVQTVLSADATDPDGNLASVGFYVNGILVGTDVSAPFQINWMIPAYGNYSIYAIAMDAEGLSAQSATSSISVLDNVVEVAITTANDDVEEIQNGTIWQNNNDLELAYDNAVSGSQGLVGHQHVGLRFRNVAVPKDAVITNAYIQFTADETDNAATTITIKGEYVGDAAPFSYAAYNVSNRTKTTAFTTWQPAPWTTVGAAGLAERTPDISAVVEEIVGHAGWVIGNDMVLILYGNDTNKRVAESYDGLPSGVAVLHVEFTSVSPLNQEFVNTAFATDGNQPVMEVFPNPVVAEEVKIHLNKASEQGYLIELTSLQGKIMETCTMRSGETGILTLPVKNLPAGAYFIRLIDGNKFVETKKIVMVK